jgi:hypothetical protein
MHTLSVNNEKKKHKKCQSAQKNHISTELIGVKNEKNTKNVNLHKKIIYPSYIYVL